MEPEALRFAFETLAPDSPFAEAKLELNLVEPKVKCRDCGAENIADPRLLACGKCGSHTIDIEAGRDFLLTSIDVEE